ncbi:tetratricopeptide repeat protein [Alphaproteobacteria bacterium]|nr:tetratricopeptide repeat protein [Alphaproteobacteria bacterium]
MADIFDEINEDLKRDQMQKLWSRYGKYVIIAASLVVIGVGARQGYTAWQDRQATEAAAIYHQALKADDTASALAAQLDMLGSGYTMLAQFRIAATQAENKDFDAAEASYLALSTDPDVKPLYQQAATLLSVMNAPASRKQDELAARLTDLENQAGPWQSMALEQAAGLALRSGDRKAAMTKYESLAGLSDIPAGVRQRARQMLQILKG